MRGMRARSRPRGAIAIAVCAVAWLSSPAAIAQTPAERARAAELKRHGDELMDGLKPEEAVKEYEAAFAITQDPALYYNKGRAYQVMGRFPEALTELEAFEKKAPPELKARVPTLSQIIAEVRAKTCTLSLRSVAGARVLVGDRVVGTVGPDGSIRIVVNAGKGKLEVTKDGYAPFRREVDLPSSGTLSLEAPLVAQQSAGILIVNVAPREGRVFIDGRAYGSPPVEVAVDPGTHTVRVDATGYEEQETSAVVEAKGRKEIELQLKKGSGSVFSQWWFWAGVSAVVIAGGVVLVYAATTEREPGTGDIPPGRVTGPLLKF